MKKFILGLIVGILLAIPITVSATNELTAYLYPSKITIHRGDDAVELNSMPDPVISYKNRTYVPLRAFSTAMGYSVNYEKASDSNGNIHQINLYDISNKLPDAEDPDGYVSLYFTNKSKTENGNIKIEGLIKINEDISDKIVDFGNAFSIDNQLTQPLNKGQIRKFNTLISPNVDMSEYPVSVGTWKTPSDFMVGGAGGPQTDLAVFFSGKWMDPPISIGRGYYQQDSVGIYNSSSNTIRVKSLKLTYSMYKIEDEKETLICTYEVPEFDEGYIDLPSSQSISLSIPAWDFRDKNGNFVSPGTYEIRTTTPAKFECYIDGEFKTIPMEHLGQRAIFILAK